MILLAGLNWVEAPRVERALLQKVTLPGYVEMSFLGNPYWNFEMSFLFRKEFNSFFYEKETLCSNANDFRYVLAF